MRKVNKILANLTDEQVQFYGMLIGRAAQVAIATGLLAAAVWVLG
jgi:hypothetical protein